MNYIGSIHDYYHHLKWTLHSFSFSFLVDIKVIHKVSRLGGEFS